MEVWLEAALDSASKLWGELTIGNRQTAVLVGHVPESIARRSPKPTLCGLGARTEPRSVYSLTQNTQNSVQ